MDEARLQDERRSRAHMRDRMSGRRQNSLGEDEGPRRARSVPPGRPQNKWVAIMRFHLTSLLLSLTS